MPPKFAFPTPENPKKDDAQKRKYTIPPGVTIYSPISFKELPSQFQEKVKSGALTLEEAHLQYTGGIYESAFSVPTDSEKITELFEKIKNQNETAQEIFNKLSPEET